MNSDLLTPKHTTDFITGNKILLICVKNQEIVRFPSSTAQENIRAATSVPQQHNLMTAIVSNRGKYRQLSTSQLFRLRI